MRTTRRGFYEEIHSKTRKDEEITDREETKSFWKDIRGQATEHDRDMPWITRARNELLRPNKQEDVEISAEMIKRRL